MCTQLFLHEGFILAANLSPALPALAGKKMLLSSILPLEQLWGIWCLKYLWALIYTPLILLKWWLQKWEIKHHFQ